MQLEARATRKKYSFHKQLSVGVVIPCHNNSRQLYGVLKALTYQSIRPDALVVVDDNSDPIEQKRLKALCKIASASFRRLPPPQNEREALGRRSHARNIGSKCLDTDLVLYLDGDMLVVPTYIEEIRHYHTIMPCAYIRGQRYGIPEMLQARGMDFCVNEVVRQSFSYVEPLPGYMIDPEGFAGKRALKSAYRDRWDWCASNNLSVRNVYISQIGYWDENFVGWGEEDIDFSYRLFKSGLTPILLASDNAASYHLDHPIDHEKNAVTLRANVKYITSKFPEIAKNREAAYALYNIAI